MAGSSTFIPEIAGWIHFGSSECGLFFGQLLIVAPAELPAMSHIDASPAIACPSCHQPMQSRDLERHDHGTVRIDLCFGCAAIWFDHLESVQLAPAAVIELFKEIYAHRDDARRPVASRLACPRCGNALALSFDFSKSGRFSYFRCPREDGRFTPFLQFLREKQFVRSLTAVEIQRVRAQVRQIKCSECGAPIDLEHDTECKYCHAALSFLDPEAVEKALRMWAQTESRGQPGASPEALGHAAQGMQLHKPERSAPTAQLGDRLLLAGAPASDGGGVAPRLDLVAMGIHAIGRLIEGRW